MTSKAARNKARRAAEGGRTHTVAPTPAVAEPIGDDRYWAARSDAARSEIEEVARRAAAGKLGPPVDSKSLAERISARRAR